MLLVVTAACVVTFQYVESLLTSSRSPSESALDSTALVLEAVRENQGQPVPTDLPFDVRSGVNQCWTFLQEAMAKNNNRYELVVVSVWGDYGTPTSHNADEVLIEVVFPDGTRAEMQYYNNTLEVCRDTT